MSRAYDEHIAQIKVIHHVAIRSKLDDCDYTSETCVVVEDFLYTIQRLDLLL